MSRGRATSTGSAASATPMATAGTTATPARDRLLQAAAELFYADGMAATGIDAIIARAGVAKMSLYNNFANKDALTQAYLQARHEEWLALYAARLRQASGPRDGILAVFDAYLDHAQAAYPHGFRGCGLLNAAAELPVGAPGRDTVRQHKEDVEGILAGHLHELVPADRVAATAEHLSFLLEGSMSRAGLEADPTRLQHARTLAESIVDAG